MYHKLFDNRLGNRSFLKKLNKKLSVYAQIMRSQCKTQITHASVNKRSQYKNLFPLLPSVKSKAKRLIDLIGALVGLSITAVLYIFIAPAIYFDDPGPIFFRQTRVGLHGQTFCIWKFRSMVKDAEKHKHLVTNEAEGYIFKNQNDPRITRIGHFLRRTSLDEFPQFLNVLKGEMSLVGTRPPTPDEVSQYLPHHFKRLQVKPGLTGEWQVNGRSMVKDFEEIVNMDLLYQRQWSLGYDLKLIFKTVVVVFTKQGAY